MNSGDGGGSSFPVSVLGAPPPGADAAVPVTTAGAAGGSISADVRWSRDR